jgi:hypothetical protein
MLLIVYCPPVNLIDPRQINLVSSMANFQIPNHASLLLGVFFVPNWH